MTDRQMVTQKIDFPEAAFGAPIEKLIEWLSSLTDICGGGEVRFCRDVNYFEGPDELFIEYDRLETDEEMTVRKHDEQRRRIYEEAAKFGNQQQIEYLRKAGIL